MADEVLTTPIVLTQATHYDTGWIKFSITAGGVTAECQLNLKSADGGPIVRPDVVDLGTPPAQLRQDIRTWVIARLKALGKVN